MSLWLENLGLSLHNCGDDREKRAKCILAHLSMTVPRSWWERAIQTGSVPDDSYIQILQELREELQEIPSLAEQVEFASLVALAFADDKAGEREPRFGTVHSLYSIEEYLSKAKQVLKRRPNLSKLGEMVDKRARFLV